MRARIVEVHMCISHWFAIIRCPTLCLGDVPNHGDTVLFHSLKYKLLWKRGLMKAKMVLVVLNI
jgi:hypothetical protein